MATLLLVLNNHADIKSAGGVALRVRTQGDMRMAVLREATILLKFAKDADVNRVL